MVLEARLCFHGVSSCGGGCGCGWGGDMEMSKLCLQDSEEMNAGRAEFCLLFHLLDFVPRNTPIDSLCPGMTD